MTLAQTYEYQERLLGQFDAFFWAYVHEHSQEFDNMQMLIDAAGKYAIAQMQSEINKLDS